MPTITQSHTIEITPERFVNACSDLELFELDRLLGTAPIQARLMRMQGDRAVPERPVTAGTIPLKT